MEKGDIVNRDIKVRLEEMRIRLKAHEFSGITLSKPSKDCKKILDEICIGFRMDALIKSFPILMQELSFATSAEEFNSFYELIETAEKKPKEA